MPPLLNSSDCKQLLSWCSVEAPALFGFPGGERCARKQVEKLLWGQKGGQEQGPAVLVREGWGFLELRHCSGKSQAGCGHCFYR